MLTVLDPSHELTPAGVEHAAAALGRWGLDGARLVHVAYRENMTFRVEAGAGVVLPGGGDVVQRVSGQRGLHAPQRAQLVQRALHHDDVVFQQ